MMTMHKTENSNGANTAIKRMQFIFCSNFKKANTISYHFQDHSITFQSYMTLTTYKVNQYKFYLEHLEKLFIFYLFMKINLDCSQEKILKLKSTFFINYNNPNCVFSVCTYSKNIK